MLKLKSLLNEAKFEGKEYNAKDKKKLLAILTKDMKALDGVETDIASLAAKVNKVWVKATDSTIGSQISRFSDKLYDLSDVVSVFYNKQTTRVNNLEKLKSIDEAILWSGNSTQAFKTNEDATFEPVNTNTNHDVQTEARGMDTKTFIKAVKDEFDVETLEMMQGIIQKQITLVQKMGDMANPRKTVKGFKK